MKTKKQLQEMALGIVQSHFFSDEDCEFVWEPLENVDENVIDDRVLDLANSI